MQNNSINKSIFHFLGARIWAPMLVYRYENPSGYITGSVQKMLTVLFKLVWNTHKSTLTNSFEYQGKMFLNTEKSLVKINKEQP